MYDKGSLVNGTKMDFNIKMHFFCKCSGYMAPEYALHGNLSVKADVYSYGVVVLELISGQKNSAFKLDLECENLLDWVRIFRCFLTFEVKCNTYQPQPNIDILIQLTPKVSPLMLFCIKPIVTATKFCSTDLLIVSICKSKSSPFDFQSQLS